MQFQMQPYGEDAKPTLHVEGPGKHWIPLVEVFDVLESWADDETVANEWSLPPEGYDDILSAMRKILENPNAWVARKL